MGTMDAFILKMKERKCTNAQLEINRVTVETQKKYEYALRMKIHPRAEEMMNYTKYAMLAQVSLSLLAQANKQNDMVLQLLQSM